MAEEREQDQDSKTLDPTDHKIEKALEEGQAPISKELSHVAFVLALCVVTSSCSWWSSSITQKLKPFLSTLIETPLTGLTLQNIVQSVTKNIALPLFLILSPFAVLAWILGIGQSYNAITPKLLMPKWNRLSLKQGMKKIFSMQAVVEFLKTLVKAICLIFIMWFSIPFIAWDQMISFTPQHMAYMMKGWLWAWLLVLGSVIVLVAIFDIVYQRFQHKKKLRMSHQDMRDEQKEMDGDPTAKRRRRDMAIELQRMLKAIPKATVVVTNPTHYAIALLWKDEGMDAPQIIGKGRDEMAFKIRDIAKRNNVPIVENPPLARALFDQANVGDLIPAEHYQVVADVIRYVQEIKQRPI